MKDGIVMVAALVAIVVLAVVIYLGALYFQRLNNARISAIEDITAKIEANSQEDELAAISKLNLTGESLAAFEELDKSYRALINRELPFLVERLKDVKEANQHFSFPTVKSDLETLEAKGAAANMAFTKIIKQIKQIKQQTDQHQQNWAEQMNNQPWRRIVNWNWKLTNVSWLSLFGLSFEGNLLI